MKIEPDDRAVAQRQEGDHDVGAPGFAARSPATLEAVDALAEAIDLLAQRRDLLQNRAASYRPRSGQLERDRPIVRRPSHPATRIAVCLGMAAISRDLPWKRGKEHGPRRARPRSRGSRPRRSNSRGQSFVSPGGLPPGSASSAWMKARSIMLLES